ncbi:unnamed protein product [Adineta steineri]|uniref:Uncharacterized protein n=1 Tax=Adineta steineri TaxID=433720 RepID=A0A813P5G6_9BILA|nr:unnamed protein product [Adineta steineri]
MKEEKSTKNREKSGQSTQKGGNNSSRYFNFLDRSHSVFQKPTYYNDLIGIHPWLRRPLSRHSGIPFPAISGTPVSPRFDELAQPKIRRQNHIRQEFFDNEKNYSYSGVSSGALTADCSPTISELARPKGTGSRKRSASQPPPHSSGNDGRAQPANTNGSAKQKKK